MSAEDTLYCSFCGKSQHDVRKLIAGPTVFICDECVELCTSIIREDYKTLLVKNRAAVPTPTEILKVLDGLIDGQDFVKNVLSMILHRHYQCLADASKQAGAVSSPTNILLCGPSMGRSEIARALMRFLDMPFVAVDAAKLIETQEPREVCQLIIRDLLGAASYNVRQAQQGFIYVDDFDQLVHLTATCPGGLTEVSEVVQEALISIMRGTVVDVTTDVGTVLSVDTRSIAFICGGTFLGLSNLTTSEPSNPATGEDANEQAPNQLEGPLHLSDAEAEAFVGFGLLPDLVSCFSAVVTLAVSEHAN